MPMIATNVLGRRLPAPITTLLLTIGLSGCSGCRADAVPIDETAQTPDPAAKQGTAVGKPGADAAVIDRELWFADGPGREAILARERQDHDAAVALLDRLLADPSLSPDDRGAAQWLRGLEDLRLQQFAAAADRFAEARKAPGLAPVDLRLGVLEAQARLDGGQPSDAMKLVDAVAASAVGSPLADDLLVIEADARARTDDEAGATAAYRRYLDRYPNGARQHEVRVKLARALAKSEAVGDLQTAVGLYERLLLDTPLSDFGAEAESVLPGLRAKAGVRRKAAESQAFERDVALGRIDALVGRGRYREAIKAADAWLRRRIDAADKCRVLFAKGTAIFKNRERAKSKGALEGAAAACGKAGPEVVELEVKSRYQAGRAVYAEGRHLEAAKVFERLATEHPGSNYADDAWVLAGESWAEAGDAARAKAAWQRALQVSGGDMHDEARRRLLLAAFAEVDHAEALAIAEAGLTVASDPDEVAKLEYFRGRALKAAGRGDDAVEAWLAVLRAEPLGYAAMQALSRLRDHGPEAVERGLNELRGAGEQRESVRAPAGAERALILARLGLGDEAAEELQQAEIDGWPAVAVLNQAGLYAEGQRLLGSMHRKWRAEPPVEGGDDRWTLAHPRPFADIVHDGEGKYRVPHLLTFAVMQTESRFDPGVTSWAGAKGLVQLMPATAKGLAAEAGVTLESDSLFDPRTNLALGMLYLAKLIQRFGGSEAAVALAVPSYNAGAGAVDRWLDERGSWDLDLFVEAIPYDETRAYTQRVLGRWFTYRWLYGQGEPHERVPYLPLKIPGRG